MARMKDCADEEDQRNRNQHDCEAHEEEEIRGGVSRLVLDVLKPHQLPTIELGEELFTIDGVSKASITVREVDAETETLRISLDGSRLDYKLILNLIEAFGATVRSIDEAVLER